MPVAVLVDVRLDEAERRERRLPQPAQAVGGDVGHVDVERAPVERDVVGAPVHPGEHVVGDEPRGVPVPRLGGVDRDGERPDAVRHRGQRRADGARVQDRVARVRALVGAREHEVGPRAEPAVGGDERDERGGGAHGVGGDVVGQAGGTARLDGQPAVALGAQQRGARPGRLPGGRRDDDLVPGVERRPGEHRQAGGVDPVVVGHECAHAVLLRVRVRVSVFGHAPRAGVRSRPRP